MRLSARVLALAAFAYWAPQALSGVLDLWLVVSQHPSREAAAMLIATFTR